MATPEAGTKRVCPESGKKFYDLNKDPIISPYTGESYPLSFFEVEKAEAVKSTTKDKPAEDSKTDDDDDDDDGIGDDAVEIVTLEDADAEAVGDVDVPGLEDDDESEIELADDDNTFLETDDDDNDVSDLIVDADDDDKDN